MAGNSTDSGRSVTNKVVAILLIFTGGNAFSLTEMARLAGLPISTAHRLATELAAWGMLERTEEGSYRAGDHLRMIGSHSMPAASRATEKARRVMEDLAVALDRATVRFGVLQDLHVAFIEKLPGSRPVSMSHEASTGPAHATAMGKALLAFSPPQTVELLIAEGLARYTSKTLTSPERLRRALAVTRLTHVAIVRGELDPAAYAVAVPVFAGGGEALGALELQARDPLELRRMQPSLVVAARGLSRELATTHARDHFMATVERRFGPPRACDVDAVPQIRRAAG